MSETHDTSDPGQEPASSASPLRRFRTWWLGLRAWQNVAIIVAVVAAVVGVMFLVQRPGGEGAATDACQKRVELRLKSPSTAEFGDSNARRLGSTEGRWEVTGIVDAQNGFGAFGRLTYKCDLTWDGDVWNAALVDVRE